jgi:hypothetical protein
LAKGVGAFGQSLAGFLPLVEMTGGGDVTEDEDDDVTEDDEVTEDRA